MKDFKNGIQKERDALTVFEDVSHSKNNPGSEIAQVVENIWDQVKMACLLKKKKTFLQVGEQINKQVANELTNSKCGGWFFEITVSSSFF